ncbi:GNAT family protein [Streptomyces sp. NPDC005900]|uniref:GNAT family N-acetyltransferase n=1 Tax=unclassified Streptomyces TaxID=2593676 RepID=UPI0004CB9FF8|nr:MULTISPECIES: GNAT family protein [unclassified Streptomyces]AZM57354.1 N-acetyltransferase [Streptomyces sp. WAC 01529]
MTGQKRRLLPSELTVRPATVGDQSLLDTFISNERIAEMAESGFTASDENTRTQVLPLIEQGLIKGWFVELPGHGALSVQIYAPTGTPGVWSGDTINAPDVDGLPFRWIGTACMAVTLDALFADEEVYRLCGHVAVTNPPSLAMCDRLGFTREGIAREHMPVGPGRRADAVVMGMLRREWQGAATLEKLATA